MTASASLYGAIRDETGTVLLGNDDIVEALTIALLSRGHVLLEGVPGVAKTTIARLFATASGLEYARVQMAPDVLPADVTGSQVYRQNTGEFETRLGPIFANVVVVDEINRATPKTQSALLEAMQERQVTIDGETTALPSPFLIVATQNPIESDGTYDLPQAQRDRFQFKLRVDYPERTDEIALLERFDETPELGPDAVSRVTTIREIAAAQLEVDEVYVDDQLFEYIVDIVTATREHPDLEYGASPRATLAFLRGGKARAAIQGRDYVIPDDIKTLAPMVLGHRVTASVDAELAGVDARSVVDEIVESVTPPGARENESSESTDRLLAASSGTNGEDGTVVE